MARKKTAQASVNPATAEAVKEGVGEREQKGALDDIDIGALLNADPTEILELLNALGPRAVPMIKGLYDDFMKQYRPILKMAPALVGMVGKDAAPIVAALMTAFDELVNAEEMQTAMAAGRKTRATSRKRDLVAYENAGLTRQEALALVLQDMASTHSMVSTAIRSTSVSRK